MAKKEKNQYYPYPEAKIICSCGNVMKVGSTVKEMHVEICSQCHPFYTGKQKFIDTAGQLEKFQKRLAKKKLLEKKEGKKK
ncbi:MAG: 50S ribosomal protein L31 [Patescibacteria group bacterium]|nr:50S ribosomal protein L31 [Patescibacteria group bacterium]